MYIKQTAAPDLIEHWWGTNGYSVQAQNVTPSCYGGQTDVPGNYQSPGYFTVPGTYQNSTTTRGCPPMGYGAAINYNTPDINKMAMLNGGGAEARLCGYQPQDTNCNCTGYALSAPPKVGSQNAYLSNQSKVHQVNRIRFN